MGGCRGIVVMSSWLIVCDIIVIVKSIIVNLPHGKLCISPSQLFVLTVSSFGEKGRTVYPFRSLELLDCKLTEWSLERLGKASGISYLTTLCLDYTRWEDIWLCFVWMSSNALCHSSLSITVYNILSTWQACAKISIENYIISNTNSAFQHWVVIVTIIVKLFCSILT